jgi:hypothetical protein
MEILDEDNHENDGISNFAVSEIKSTFPWIMFVGIANIIFVVFNLYSLFTRGISVLGIVIAILFLSANIILLVSGSHFKNFTKFGKLSELEDALEKQKQYWQFM